MNSALITLHPHDAYFFGGEQTFGNGDGANYFSKSNLYPQQSAITGLLRHLLFANGYDRGSDSFNPTVQNLDFGDLLGLSPLFLVRKNSIGHTDYFLPQAMDRQETNLLALLPSENGAIVFSDFYPDAKQARTWVDFKPKIGLGGGWVSATTNQPVPHDHIFIPVTRPGITKVRRGAVRDDADGFYKQTSYHFKNDETYEWSFGVLADFTDKVNLNDLDGFCLPFGGEKTIFSISLQSETRSFDQLLQTDQLYYPDGLPNDSLLRLVLVSDAFAATDIYRHTIGGITETIDFRHIHTPVKVRNYAPLRPLSPNEDRPEDKLSKSTKYTLLQRGSVLLAENDNQLKALKTALTEALEPWIKAGFNRFV
jgi:CRISPR type III-B/RAMP module-associated protein Cmr3